MKGVFMRLKKKNDIFFAFNTSLNLKYVIKHAAAILYTFKYKRMNEI